MPANHSPICVSLSRKKNDRMIAENAMKNAVAVLTAIAPSDASAPLTMPAVFAPPSVLTLKSRRPADRSCGKCWFSELSASRKPACAVVAYVGQVARQQLHLIDASAARRSPADRDHQDAAPRRRPRSPAVWACGVRAARAIGPTPNAMNAAIVKIVIVRGMWLGEPQHANSATTIAGPRSSRRGATTSAFIAPCTADAAR